MNVCNHFIRHRTVLNRFPYLQNRSGTVRLFRLNGVVFHTTEQVVSFFYRFVKMKRKRYIVTYSTYVLYTSSNSIPHYKATCTYVH